LKNEEFLKTNKLERGKGVSFKGAAPKDINYYQYFCNQKPIRLNLKFMSAVNNDNKTNGNNSQSWQFKYNFFLPTQTIIVFHAVSSFVIINDELEVFDSFYTTS
jgi:hypothetical protein